MTIRERVIATLGITKIPVFFGGWTPSRAGAVPPDVYVVFTTASFPGEYEDDARTAWTHYVYLNLWAKGPYSNQFDSIIAEMESAGFEVSERREMYDPQTRMNECAMTWAFLEHLEPPFPSLYVDTPEGKLKQKRAHGWEGPVWRINEDGELIMISPQGGME